MLALVPLSTRHDAVVIAGQVVFDLLEIDRAAGHSLGRILRNSNLSGGIYAANKGGIGKPGANNHICSVQPGSGRDAGDGQGRRRVITRRCRVFRKEAVRLGKFAPVGFTQKFVTAGVH